MTKSIITILVFLSLFAKTQILDKDFTWLDQDYKSVKEVKAPSKISIEMSLEFSLAKCVAT